jgi:hypothetical protein
MAIAECKRLIEESDRLFGESNPKLAREVKDALEEKLKDLMIKVAKEKT